MKNREQELLQKYMEGNTTLQEEKELRTIQAASKSGASPWFSYVEQETIDTPKGLAEELWEESQIKSARKRTGIKALVLGIIFLAVLSIGLFAKVQATEKPKNNIYQQAMAVIGDNTVVEKKEIFYKNELLTIYLSYEE